MKKYVLNIEKLYSGNTANALVLKQVDKDFPILVSNPPEDGLEDWIGKWRRIYKDFDPQSYDIDYLREYVLEFNLNLQQKFKDSGHEELYMMDETMTLNSDIDFVPYVRINHAIGEYIEVCFEVDFPGFRQLKRIQGDFTVEMEKERLDNANETIVKFLDECQESHKGFEYHKMDYPIDAIYEVRQWNELCDRFNDYVDGLNDFIYAYNVKGRGSVQYGKRHMHQLNGLSIPDSHGHSIVSSSQMNVLFPQKKMSMKSLYASQLKVSSDIDYDDELEKALGITLRGQVSYEKCLQGVASVGNNLYIMSPDIEVQGMFDFNGMNHASHSNDITAINGRSHGYSFPHTMTLFQPSQGQWRGSTIQAFSDWYEWHNNKTVVNQDDVPGTNVSVLKCLGRRSFELSLGSYGIDALTYGDVSNGKIVSDDSVVRLNSDTFRSIRAQSDFNGVKGRYSIDNREKDLDIGFMFNLYDTFVSGNEKILKISVPRSKDSNSLTFSMKCNVVNNGLLGDFNYQVRLNGDMILDSYSDKQELKPGRKSIPIADSSIRDNEMVLSIFIYHQVDYNKRNINHDYRNNLIKSGIVFSDIRIEDEFNRSKLPTELTFGSYVNEDGISEMEHMDRLNKFWEVSQCKRNISYQTILESSLKNILTNGIGFQNNYSSGDMYGDIFATKSYLNPIYNMEIGQTLFEVDEEGKWNKVGHREEIDPTKSYEELDVMASREYIGIGQCSNQLYLLFNPTNTYLEKLNDDDNKPSDKVYKVREVPEKGQLNYQLVEVVKNINRFESYIKHKINLFSVVVENTNLQQDRSEATRNEEIEKLKEHMRNSISQFVRNTCRGITPAHTQLFDVQFK